MKKEIDIYNVFMRNFYMLWYFWKKAALLPFQNTMNKKYVEAFLIKSHNV